jgi:L-2-hydroxyglutarate oxidase LhgO
MEKIDVVVVGGGIVGLWTAYEILTQNPKISLAVFEREKELGEHSTGRNSEVLHSGIYYPYGSLKWQTCLIGNRMWRDFISLNSLSFLDCGKFVVAKSSETEKLGELYRRGEKNQVPNLRMATAQEVFELKKSVSVDEAFFCPSSGVLNVSEALKTLTNLVESMGGVILKSQNFTVAERIENGFVFVSEGQKMVTKTLINAAGHGAVNLRSRLGLTNFSNRWVKGNYVALKRSLDLKHLVYPIPPAHGLGLGVHLTLDVSGAQKFGPNTEEVSNLDYSQKEDLIGQMFPAIAELFPSVKPQDLSLAYSGIRSKILDSNGVLVTDYVLGTPKEHGVSGYFEFLGIESPGVTAAPALAKLMCTHIDFS